MIDTETTSIEIARMLDSLTTAREVGMVGSEVDGKVHELRTRYSAGYRAGRALVGEATPQSHPHRFTDAAIRAEIGYLLRLNKRYGTHVLRVKAYLALTEHLKARRTA